MSLTEENKTAPAKPDNVRDFLLYLEGNRGCSKATVESYGRDIIQFELFLKRKPGKTLDRPAEVDRDDVRGFLAELHRQGCSKSSMARKLSALRTFFKRLAFLGLVQGNPPAGVANPKQEVRRPKILNVDQAFALMDSSGRTHVGEGGQELEVRLRDLALAELLYGSGLRVSEALGLDLADVRPSSGVVRVLGKGSKERLAPLSDASRLALEAYINARPRLSPQPGENALFLGVRAVSYTHLRAHET